MRRLAGWGPALRVARRETTRAKGRSILVLAMIALPVLGVTAADVVMQTAEITGAEAIERRVGTGDAMVSVSQGITAVRQTADPDREGWSGDGRAGAQEPQGLDDLSEALGRPLTGIEVRNGSVRVGTESGVADVEVIETDLRDDLTDGLYRMEDGRLPVSTDEVVVNGALAERGIALGDRLDVLGREPMTVVGIGESTTYGGYPLAVSLPDAFGLREPGDRMWLVETEGDITWDDVESLNAVGARVLSRAVLLDPPPRAQLPEEFQHAMGVDDSALAVLALVVVMALMEVVLLAGPAFAVIARRMQRTLALMSASGATPRQARRVVLATGLVLGSVGAVLGLGLGLLVAWLSLPVVQRFSSTYLGPFDVPWLHLVGIAGFGLLSAFLAAVVPAWLASRQDVVAVLAGRRGEGRPSVRSPLLGVAFVAVGIAVSVWGARAEQPFSIAVAAVVTVLGMLLLVPVVVALVARLAARLPLPTRYAVRDAARHRTRTVPAVAAVAATVAGVVALGIATASDEAEQQATYAPRLAMGQGAVTSLGAEQDWEAYGAAARRFLPEADVVPLVGVPDEGRRWTEVDLRLPGSPDPLSMWSSWVGTSMPVATDDALPPAVVGLSAEDRTGAEAVLADGGVVVFTDQGARGDEALVRTREYRRGPDERSQGTFDAYVVEVTGREALVPGVLSAAAADRLGLTYRTVGLVVGGVDISEEQERDVNEALEAHGENSDFYVERGYQPDEEYVVVLLVLGSLGALLMLGGTLTATFLSLSDARPDLATLAAVGAAPRTRRAVAASYALVIGLLGAVLGTLVGFVPGIAVTYPLTGASWLQQADPSVPDHFLDVPWLLIASLVVVLPLFTALVVGVATRSRLPLVARLD